MFKYKPPLDDWMDDVDSVVERIEQIKRIKEYLNDTPHDPEWDVRRGATKAALHSQEKELRDRLNELLTRGHTVR